MEAGRQAAEALGYDYITVLGSEDYYPRAGYIPAEQLGIRAVSYTHLDVYKRQGQNNGYHQCNGPNG